MKKKLGSFVFFPCFLPESRSVNCPKKCIFYNFVLISARNLSRKAIYTYASESSHHTLSKMLWSVMLQGSEPPFMRYQQFLHKNKLKSEILNKIKKFINENVFLCQFKLKIQSLLEDWIGIKNKKKLYIRGVH